MGDRIHTKTFGSAIRQIEVIKLPQDTVCFIPSTPRSLIGTTTLDGQVMKYPLAAISRVRIGGCSLAILAKEKEFDRTILLRIAEGFQQLIDANITSISVVPENIFWVDSHVYFTDLDYDEVKVLLHSLWVGTKKEDQVLEKQRWLSNEEFFFSPIKIEQIYAYRLYCLACYIATHGEKPHNSATNLEQLLSSFRTEEMGYANSASCEALFGKELVSKLENYRTESFASILRELNKMIV